MAIKDVAEIDAQIEKLRTKKAAVLKRESDRVARIAGSSGLLELGLEDDALLAAFKDVAARFRDKASKPHGAAAEAARPAHSRKPDPAPAVAAAGAQG